MGVLCLLSYSGEIFISSMLPQEYSYGMAEDTGLEPATVSPAAAFKAVCFPFAYPPWYPKMWSTEPKAGIEPATFPLQGERSAN